MGVLEILGLILASFISGVFGAYLTGGRRQAYPITSLEQQNIELRQDNSFLKKENMDLIERIHQTEKRVYVLEQRMLLVEGFQNDIPLPTWVKDPKTGVMEFVNKDYESVFLKPLGKTIDDYIGKTDYEIWPERVADEFARNDEWVFRTKELFNGRETIVDGEGNEIQYHILKWVRWAGNIPLGVSGMAIPENGDLQTYLKNRKK